MNVLSVAEMYKADRAAIDSGVSGLELMDAAGHAVAGEILNRWEQRPVCVLCGPGNNGGDGFVIARALKQAGWSVTVYLLGEKAELRGDAALHAKKWRNKVQPLDAALERIALAERAGELLVVDALFGAGLARPLDGTPKILAELLTVCQAQGNAPIVVAVDVPSGLHGDTGRTMGGKRGGICVHADLTVTFCRPKPAHALMPGRAVCGEIVVADIGIGDDIVATLDPQTDINTPELWGVELPDLQADAHKYARGHLVVVGGEVMTGAARLVADGARRTGAGLVSIACPQKSFPIYAAAVQPGTLTPPFKTFKEFRAIVDDPRKNTVVVGPGAGVKKATRSKVLAVLKAGKRCVLDADALSVFAKDPDALFQAAKAHKKTNHGLESIVLTPHGGEFPRLFPDLAKRYLRARDAKDSKLALTRRAAKRSNCVVLFKGPDTVIAAPDGRVAITVNAPPWLATAGAGDVLAGMIGALMAQGMPAFEAANAAAWLHGEAADAFGPGLIAEDIINELPGVFDGLWERLG